MRLIGLFATAAMAALSFTACNQEAAEETNTTSAQTEADAMLLNTQPAAPGGLSGAQSASVVAQPAAAAQQKTTVGTTQAAKTAAGMNPEHGQPGHRCDIAVGAPLSSAPAVATSATQAVPAPQAAGASKGIQVSPASATPATTAPASGSGKLNPAHGQPGHDCAIPVGAPLKS